MERQAIMQATQMWMSSRGGGTDLSAPQAQIVCRRFRILTWILVCRIPSRGLTLTCENLDGTNRSSTLSEKWLHVDSLLLEPIHTPLDLDLQPTLKTKRRIRHLFPRSKVPKIHTKAKQTKPNTMTKTKTKKPKGKPVPRLVLVLLFSTN